MIDSVAILQLFKVLVDISTDSGGLSEIHGSPFYCYYFAGCHESTVYRSITIGIQCQQVSGVIRRRITIQVEVRMVGHVDNGRFICFCFILYIDGIVICQFHDNGALQIAGESFFSVLCQISQLQFLVALLYPFVHTILETFRTAVQAMAVVILRQLIFHTIQCEASLINTIGISSDTCSEIRRIFDVVLYGIKAQYHILHVSILVGNHDRYDAASEISDTHFHLVLVLQNEQVRFLTIDFCLEIASLQSGFGQFFFCSCGTSSHQNCAYQKNQFIHIVLIKVTVAL